MTRIDPKEICAQLNSIERELGQILVRHLIPVPQDARTMIELRILQMRLHTVAQEITQILLDMPKPRSWWGW